jgi:hypothetical protein
MYTRMQPTHCRWEQLQRSSCIYTRMPYILWGAHAAHPLQVGTAATQLMYIYTHAMYMMGRTPYIYIYILTSAAASAAASAADFCSCSWCSCFCSCCIYTRMPCIWWGAAAAASAAAAGDMLMDRFRNIESHGGLILFHPYMNKRGHDDVSMLFWKVWVCMSFWIMYMWIHE